MRQNSGVIVQLAGGMGNQMFQYSLGRAISLRHKVPLKVDLSTLLDRTPRPGFVFRDYALDVFDIKAQTAVRREVPILHRRYLWGRGALLIDQVRREFLANPGKERRGGFEPAILQAGPSVYLAGYWQCPKYFTQIESVIRADFTLRSSLPKSLAEMRNAIALTNSVCVNVRRTDFVNNPVHGILDVEYYRRALKLLENNIQSPHVFVFADDLAWCQDNLQFGMPTTFVGNEFAGSKFEYKFELMRACKHFVIPNSTYAWWAAWLSDNPSKRVVAPEQWLPESISDIVPEEWLRA
jgi:hypothetical protein